MRNQTLSFDKAQDAVQGDIRGRNQKGKALKLNLETPQA